jgi:ankyrin repeat protein
VAYLIRLGVDLDYKDDHGFTALHHAALSGFEDTVETLLAAGCDVNADSVDLGTPLHQAARKARTNVMDKLLSYRANVNATRGRIGNPLHCAAYAGDCAMAETLIHHGAEVCTKRLINIDLLGGRKAPQEHYRVLEPVSCAVRGGEYRMVRLLLEKGASANATWIHPGQVCTLLMEAASLNRAIICKLLIVQGARVDDRTSKGTTALQYAASHGACESLEVLIECELKLAQNLSGSGRLACIYAARAGHIDCIRILDRWGLIAKSRSQSSRYLPVDAALLAAVEGGHTEAARLLVLLGADVNAASFDGMTPLHGAAQYGHQDTVLALLDLGAEKNAQNATCMTPLHLAAQSCHLKVVEALVTKGADVWLRDTDNRLAQAGDVDVCDLQAKISVGEVLEDARQKNEMQYAYANFDFEGQDTDDLKFKEGDWIRILKMTDSLDDWWEGELRGTVGAFPANYVQLGTPTQVQLMSSPERRPPVAERYIAAPHPESADQTTDQFNRTSRASMPVESSTNTNDQPPPSARSSPPALADASYLAGNTAMAGNSETAQSVIADAGAGYMLEDEPAKIRRETVSNTDNTAEPPMSVSKKPTHADYEPLWSDGTSLVTFRKSVRKRRDVRNSPSNQAVYEYDGRADGRADRREDGSKNKSIGQTILAGARKAAWEFVRPHQ